MHNTVKDITSVPLLDLNTEYEPIADQVLSAIKTVYEHKQFINGPEVYELEHAIASYCGSRHAVGCSSGTDALLLSLMSLGIGSGDEVITTTFSFFATAGSIARTGATPVFVDVNPQTFNIDPSLIEAKITSKTKAIMPVHLFGQMADMDPIMAIAKKHHLFVIEDAAQAIGASYTNADGVTKKAGTVGDIGCFSFFPSKNLGCMGDGGIVTCHDDSLAEQLNVIKNHGSKPKYYHSFVGGNFRLDTLQAAVLNVKLPYLNDHHKKRQENALFYNSQLSDLQIPFVLDTHSSIYNQYTLNLSNRDKVISSLNDANIGSCIYYPVPLHLQQCFAHLGYKKGDCPIAETLCDNVLSIPIFSGLTTEHLDYVVTHLREAISTH
ncbi:MAG: DegT/DnrJ/EryC1/StrS family aminotransferase [bacterium]